MKFFFIDFKKINKNFLSLLVVLFLGAFISLNLLLYSFAKKSNYSSEIIFNLLPEFEYEKYYSTVNNLNFLNYQLVSDSINKAKIMEFNQILLKKAIIENILEEQIFEIIMQKDERFKTSYKDAYRYWMKNLIIKNTYKDNSGTALSVKLFTSSKDDLDIIDYVFDILSNSIDLKIKTNFNNQFREIIKINVYRYKEGMKFYQQAKNSITQSKNQAEVSSDILMLTLLSSILSELKSDSNTDMAGENFQLKIITEELKKLYEPNNEKLNNDAKIDESLRYIENADNLINNSAWSVNDNSPLFSSKVRLKENLNNFYNYFYFFIFINFIISLLISYFISYSFIIRKTDSV